MTIDYGHWECEHFNPDDYLGFVYVITNTVTGRQYIGQKQLHFKVKKKPLKGKVNKRHSTKESDWRTYTGSSKSLNEDIEAIGKDKFTFKIIELCESKWELNYIETKHIVKTDAVIKESYYNMYIGRVGCPPKNMIK